MKRMTNDEFRVWRESTDMSSLTSLPANLPADCEIHGLTSLPELPDGLPKNCELYGLYALTRLPANLPADCELYHLHETTEIPATLPERCSLRGLLPWVIIVSHGKLIIGCEMHSVGSWPILAEELIKKQKAEKYRERILDVIRAAQRRAAPV